MKSGSSEKWIVCRICLKQPEHPMQTIFDKNPDKDLTRMILDCGGVPIKKYDHFPDKICGKCLKYLRVAYKFRVTCQRSHKHLSRFIAPVVSDLTLELQEAEEIALKLEPEDAMGIKQELSDEEAIMEMYEPMDDDDFTADEEEFRDLDENDFSGGLQDDIEYLDDIIEAEFESDVEYKPVFKATSSKKPTKVKSIKQPKASSSRQGGGEGASTAEKKDKEKEPAAKRGPKPRKFKETSFICDVCGNIYPSQGRLTEHIKIHAGIKPHECEICGHRFVQTQQLARHMNTHTGNRPYKCNYCPAAFADLSTRNKHHRIHTNERPYICDVCGKSFTYTNTLKFHKMIHTGEKPHVCEICGKGFQQAYKLRNHKMTHEKKGVVKLERIEVETLDQYHQEQEVSAAAAQLLEI